MNKVYISGMALMSALGHEVDQVFNKLIENASSTKVMEEWKNFQGLRTLVASPVEPYDVGKLNRKVRRSMSPMSEMATLASFEALESAGFDAGNLWGNVDPQRSLICMGSTSGSPDIMETYFKKFFERGGPEGQVSTSFFKIMNHSVATNVALALDYNGALQAPSCACATSNQAMIMAWELISQGVYDFALVGGADELHHMSGATFDVVHAASTQFNDQPEQTPRPFDKDRDGLVVSEGAGILVLESEKHLQKRGATPIAEVLGGAYYCDGGHMTQPQAESMGRTMELALARSKVDKSDIDYINAHATGTLIGDVEEAQAIAQIFGKTAPVSSLKGHFGHTLAACGAIEVICSIKMMKKGVIVPTRNLSEPDKMCHDVDLPTERIDKKIDRFLSNNFAFGGMNASVVVGNV